MIEIKLTDEQAKGLQQHVSTHIDNCFEMIDMDDCTFVTPEGEVFESFAPFCGCNTCVTRETLMSTFHFLKNNKIADIFVEDEE
ncbi:MAG: hypothetical protein RLZZ196_1110 [Bacteroidota bacterium]|jgi:hypothetical protein